ncbi:MAG: CAP domain-containing protein [Acidimicrobiia bacterium]
MTLTEIRSLCSRRRVVATAVAGVLAIALLGACTPDQQDGWSALRDDRVAQGVHPIGWRQDLQDKAQSWAEHLARPGVTFAHSQLVDGVTGCWGALGENIAQNYSITGAEASFMGSPGHRANILNAQFNSFAVGVARADDGRVYVVQEFGQLC